MLNPVGKTQPKPAAGAPLSTFWLSAWSIFLAPAWLLPNHYPPWSTFHLDAWMACVSLLVALWLLIRVPSPSDWTTGPLLLLALLPVPALQFAAGLVVQAGTAWINTAYLLGFLIAWLTGARWESASRGQLADGLFLAIGLAALVSVGLQLHQWLMLERLDIWSMGGGYSRPFANLGQPNQLGTLLIWGLLALLWGFLRRHLRAPVAIAGALFLLFGVALTASRTAWVAMLLLTAAVWIWRRLWPNPAVPRTVTALAAYFFVCALSVDALSRALLGGAPSELSDIVRIANESRPAIWTMFLDAALQRPWFGYGWGQVAMAHATAALDHPALHAYFSHAHNIFLDLVLWCGLPLGLVVSAFLMWWFVSRALRVRQAQDAVLFMLLLVVANHAMLELPLHHAYFLLPVGMVMGALEVRLGIVPAWSGARRITGTLALCAALLLALIVRDYAKVEPAYQSLRYEWANIKTPPVSPPDVLLLTQWRDFVQMAKFDLVKDLDQANLQRMQDVTSLHPNTGFFQVLAITLARKGRPDQAAHWLSTMCSLMSQAQCTFIQAHWVRLAAADPQLAAVPWPRDPPPAK